MEGLGHVKGVSSLVPLGFKQRTKCNSLPSNSLERDGYSGPLRTTCKQAAANPNVHRFECGEQVSTRENAVEVNPAFGIDCRIQGAAIHNGDVVHTCEPRKIFECFHPKPSPRLAELRSDCQGL